MRSIAIFAIAAIVYVAAFIAGYFTHDILTPVEFDYSLVDQAYNILVNHAYWDTPQSPALEYGMIRGMVQAYNDPHTVFVEPAQHELQSNQLEGTYGGVGSKLIQDPDGFFVLYPFPDGPAYQEGIRDGDRILQIDDNPVTVDWTVDDVTAAIRGPVGQRVKIVIGRAPDYTPISFRIKREEAPLPSVTWHIDPSDNRLGVVEINRIAATTAAEVTHAMEDLSDQGAIGFALDLRNNAGGLVDAGIDIARLFLNDGIVIEQQYRDEPIEAFEVDTPGEFFDSPLVVLINHNTASAAEIIAGALQAHSRAALVGAPTYGKDTIQLIFDLRDGSSLHVTAAQWWVPGLAAPLGEVGLQPDFSVAAYDTPGDAFILTAIEVLFGAE